MELIDSLKTMLIATTRALKGSVRRFFMARIVKELSPGDQQRAVRDLSWTRMIIRELDSGI